VFFGKNDAKAETPVLWPPHAKNWLIGKDCDAGRDEVQEEKGTTEDEMAGWHHWLDGRESEWTPRSWWWTGRPGMLRFMESDNSKWLKWTELNWTELNLYLAGKCSVIYTKSTGVFSLTQLVILLLYAKYSRLHWGAWKVQLRLP